MNQLRETYKLENSSFACPHGLANKENISSALDITKISREAMKSKLFKTIITTKDYLGRSIKKDGL